MVLYIDTNNACNLKCPTCPRGRGEILSSNEVMSTELFEKIIIKAENAGFDWIGLFNWTEPFLNPRIHDYVRIVRQHSMSSWISSNLALTTIPHLEKTIIAGLDKLTVSVSGHDNRTHQINHVGSDVNVVYSHLRSITKLLEKNSISMYIELKLLDFYYNEHSKEALEEFCKSLNIHFCHVQAARKNLEEKRQYNKEEAEVLDSELIEVPLGRITGGKCFLIHDNIPIDHNGNAYLCCTRPNYQRYLIGSVLEMSFSEIFAHRVAHPACRKCLLDFKKYDMTEDDIDSIVKVFAGK